MSISSTEFNIYRTLCDVHRVQVDELVVVPPKKPLSRMWLWGTVALGVGGIVAGVHLLRRR